MIVDGLCGEVVLEHRQPRPRHSVGIMQLLYRINRAGTTVVMATHDREMVDKMRRAA